MTDEELEVGHQWLVDDPRALDDLLQALDNREGWAVQLYFYCRYGRPKEI